MELTFAVLMVRALDEPDAMYGLAARAVRISADGMTYRFILRPEARFHDGSKLTAHDAAFSFNILKEKGHPIIRQLMRDVETVEAVEGEATLAVKFSPKRGREIPLFVAGLPIFSRAYYTTKNFEDSTLDVPLGSGPYRVGRFEPGRFIEYERVKDWWGAGSPGRPRPEQFRLSCATNIIATATSPSRASPRATISSARSSLRAFGPRATTFRRCATAASSARCCPISRLPERRAGSSIRGGKSSRTRACGKRSGSPSTSNGRTKTSCTAPTTARTPYFQNSDMMAKGKPSPEELALLEPFRGKVAEEAFGEPFVPPVSDGSGQDRALLRRAGALLQAAGYEIKDNRRVNAKGEKIAIEFLLEEPAFQAHHAPFIKNLGILGIEASVRLVDPVQYKAREDEFDFDITIQRFSFSSTPGESLRSYFTAQAAAIKGTQNLSGIADPAVDALVEKIVEAKSRAELTIACRALDRVLRAGRYWVPHWYKPTHWLAYWDVFARPAEKPRFGRGFPERWWSDPAKDRARRMSPPLTRGRRR